MAENSSSRISYTEIFKQIEAAPPASREEAGITFVGQRVVWKLVYRSAFRNGDGTYQVYFYASDSSVFTAYTIKGNSVDATDELKTAPSRQLFLVSGIIEEADFGQITLGKVMMVAIDEEPRPSKPDFAPSDTVQADPAKEPIITPPKQITSTETEKLPPLASNTISRYIQMFGAGMLTMFALFNLAYIRDMIINEVPVWGLVLATILSGLTLFCLRAKRRFFYGAIEVCVGVAATTRYANPTSYDSTFLFQLATGVYIVVRGLDNIDKALDESGKPPPRWWKAIFRRK